LQKLKDNKTLTRVDLAKQTGQFYWGTPEA